MEGLRERGSSGRLEGGLEGQVLREGSGEKGIQGDMERYILRGGLGKKGIWWKENEKGKEIGLTKETEEDFVNEK